MLIFLSLDQKLTSRMQEPVSPLRPISVVVVDDAEDLLQLVNSHVLFAGVAADTQLVANCVANRCLLKA